MDVTDSKLAPDWVLNLHPGTRAEDWRQLPSGGWVHVNATVGDRARVGYQATVGDQATVGRWATVGDQATVGDRATVGRWATVGDRGPL